MKKLLIVLAMVFGMLTINNCVPTQTLEMLNSQKLMDDEEDEKDLFQSRGANINIWSTVTWYFVDALKSDYPDHPGFNTKVEVNEDGSLYFVFPNGVIHKFTIVGSEGIYYIYELKISTPGQPEIVQFTKMAFAVSRSYGRYIVRARFYPNKSQVISPNVTADIVFLAENTEKLHPFGFFKGNWVGASDYQDGPTPGASVCIASDGKFMLTARGRIQVKFISLLTLDGEHLYSIDTVGSNPSTKYMKMKYDPQTQCIMRSLRVDSQDQLANISINIPFAQ